MYINDGGATLANETNPGEAMEAIIETIGTKATILAVGAEDGAGVRVMVHGTAWSAQTCKQHCKLLVQQLVQTTMTHQVPLQQTLHSNLELKPPVEEECTSVHSFFG